MRSGRRLLFVLGAIALVALLAWRTGGTDGGGRRGDPAGPRRRWVHAAARALTSALIGYLVS